MAGEIVNTMGNLTNEIEESLEKDVLTDEEVEEEDSEAHSFDRNSQLHFAAAYGHLDSIKEILETPNVKIDEENFMGWTPLMMAIRNGHLEAVKLLIEKGADITKKNKLGVNCFNLSVANGDVELVNTVLRHMLNGGISRNRIQENLSPMSLAIVLKKNHLLPLLMNQGFDTNANTWKTGLTPLMFAAAVNSEKIIPMLEANGANGRIRNYMGVNHHNILKWRLHGLENIQGPSNVNRPNLTIPQIRINADPTKMNQPNVMNMAKPMLKPQVFANYQGANPVPPQNFISTPSVENNENDPNKINIQTTNDANNLYGSRRDKQVIQPVQMLDGSMVPHPYQYQSPYNGLPCPLYIPVNCMNGPQYVPSPVGPMMVNSPYSEMPENSPNQFQYPPPGHPVFFQSPLPRPDVNFVYDPMAMGSNPGMYGGPMYYTVYQNPQKPEVYTSPEVNQ